MVLNDSEENEAGHREETRRSIRLQDYDLKVCGQ